MKFCNFYPHLSLENVFAALKMTQICCINMNNFFLEVQPKLTYKNPNIPSLS